jgi:hypothetical protein
VRLFICVVVGLFFEFPQWPALAQCSDDTTVGWGRSDSLSRFNGNAVRAYSQTWVTGNYRLNYWAYIETWLYRNGSQIGHMDFASPRRGGAVAWQSYTPPLSVYGPGTYSDLAYHAWYNWACNYWDPYPGNTQGTPITVEKPTISRSEPPGLYLGGATTSGTYSSKKTLFSDPKGAPEVPTYRFTSGSSFGNLSCTTCWNPIYTATRVGTCPVYEITIVARIFNNAPGGIEVMGINQRPLTEPGVGWETDYILKTLDICGNPLSWVEVNESFASASRVYSGSNWPLPKPFDPNGWDPGVWDSQEDFLPAGDFTDYMFEYYVPGKTPLPQKNGTNDYREDAASTVTTMQQIFKGASPVSGSGILLRTNVQTHYLDHGAHK